MLREGAQRALRVGDTVAKCLPLVQARHDDADIDHTSSPGGRTLRRNMPRHR